MSKLDEILLQKQQWSGHYNHDLKVRTKLKDEVKTLMLELVDNSSECFLNYELLEEFRKKIEAL